MLGLIKCQRYDEQNKAIKNLFQELADERQRARELEHYLKSANESKAKGVNMPTLTKSRTFPCKRCINGTAAPVWPDNYAHVFYECLNCGAQYDRNRNLITPFNRHGRPAPGGHHRQNRTKLA